MVPCGAHTWRTPAVGDAALVCDVCETRLDLVRDITPDVQANILRDYRRHYGPVEGGHFQKALEAAVAAAQRNVSGQDQESSGKESV